MCYILFFAIYQVRFQCLFFHNLSAVFRYSGRAAEPYHRNNSGSNTFSFMVGSVSNILVASSRVESSRINMPLNNLSFFSNGQATISFFKPTNRLMFFMCPANRLSLFAPASKRLLPVLRITITYIFMPYSSASNDLANVAS